MSELFTNLLSIDHLIPITSTSNAITPTIYTSTLVPNNKVWIHSGNTYDYSYTSTTSASTGNVILKLKKCRNCHHGHIAGQIGCIQDSEFGGMMLSLISCECKEYVPTDNLEYLEYMYDKKRNEEI